MSDRSDEPEPNPTPTPASKRRPLAALREAYAAAIDALSKGSDAHLQLLLKELDSDARTGAKQMVERGRRQIAARLAERERLDGLMALRNSLVAKGVRGIAGIDEVGVGPLAGPVVAAAVVLPDDIELTGLDDSKRVPRARRERLAEEIRGVALGIGIGELTPEEIDQNGIYQGALEAMRRAVASLERVTLVGHLLVDARTVPGVHLPQTSIVKGDSKDASIAAASIVAKVHRDAHMEKLGRRYPAYGFEQHMGYGTAEHMAALAKHGPCPVHRRSFAPVKEAERRMRSRDGR